MDDEQVSLGFFYGFVPVSPGIFCFAGVPAEDDETVMMLVGVSYYGAGPPEDEDEFAQVHDALLDAVGRSVEKFLGIEGNFIELFPASTGVEWEPCYADMDADDFTV